MSAPTEPCAMCEHFHVAGYPKESAVGFGRCDGFDRPGYPIAFVHASTGRCVIYGAGDNVAARRSFLTKHMETV